VNMFGGAAQRTVLIMFNDAAKKKSHSWEDEISSASQQSCGVVWIRSSSPCSQQSTTCLYLSQM